MADCIENHYNEPLDPGSLFDAPVNFDSQSSITPRLEMSTGNQVQCLPHTNTN